MNPSVELRIEELVMHGFRPQDRYRIGEAVRIELSRLLGERGVPLLMARGADYSLWDARTLYVSPNSDAGLLGRRIAGTLYESFGPTTDHKGGR